MIVSDASVFLVGETSSGKEVVSLEGVITGLPVPLHPVAARFYREQGIDIPDQLIVT